MSGPAKDNELELQNLRREFQALRAQLEEFRESHETLRAIRDGEVDALVISAPEGDRIFTLQSAEQPYRVLIEQMREGAVTLILDGSIHYANRAFAEMIKRPLEQVIGSPVRDYVAESDRPLYDGLMHRCLGGSARGELSLRAADGATVPAYLSLSMLVVSGVSSICLVVTDLTEQKQSERILASERFSRAILNQAADAIVVCDAQGRLTFANAAARLQANLDPRDMTLDIGAQVWGQPYNPDGHPLPPDQWPLTAALRGQVVSGLEVHLIRPEGGGQHILLSASPLRESDGAIIGAVATFTDITRRKQTEAQIQRQNEDLQSLLEENRAIEEELRTQNDEMAAAQHELRDQRQRYADLFKLAPDAYLSTDGEGIIREANQAALDLLHTKGLVGQPLARYVAEEMRNAFRLQLFRLRQPGTRLEAEWLLAPHGRPPFYAAVTVAAVIEGTDGPTGCRWLIRDITQRKRAEEALAAAKLSAEQAKLAAEQASKAKDHFMAVLSHELRTPLSAVIPALDTLAAKLTGQDAENLEMARRNVELEARLIDDLLDVTRIARGKVELDRRPIELCTVIRRAAEVCMPDIEARQLHFDIEIDGQCNPPLWVDGDPARLQQVFWNLIKNAVKFTPQGGCVGVRVRNADGTGVVQVVDSGHGIEPDHLPILFNAFEQAERSITRQFGGLGLGLAISKALVELHGGKITAHSAGRGKGATFTVQLPLLSGIDAKSHQGSPAALAVPAGPLRILLVEDHGDTARIMRQLLRGEGHQVEHAADVATALSLATAEPFDILLSDLGLPDGSGHDLLRRLRDKGVKLKAIALSGYGMAADVQKSRDAGFDEHVTKPVNFEALQQAINRVVRANAS